MQYHNEFLAVEAMEYTGENRQQVGEWLTKAFCRPRKILTLSGVDEFGSLEVIARGESVFCRPGEWLMFSPGRQDAKLATCPSESFRLQYAPIH